MYFILKWKKKETEREEQNNKQNLNDEDSQKPSIALNKCNNIYICTYFLPSGIRYSNWLHEYDDEKFTRIVGNKINEFHITKYPRYLCTSLSRYKIVFQTPLTA